MACSRKLEWHAAAQGKLRKAGMGVGQMLDMERISEHQLGEGVIPEGTELAEGDGEAREASSPCFEGCKSRRSDRPNPPPRSSQ